MAASSCSSSLAPIDFNFASFDSSDGVTIAIERCPLCAGTRRPFLCKDCISSGSFIHSNSNFCESYMDKLQRLQSAQHNRDSLQQRIGGATAITCKLDKKRCDLDTLRQKVQLLKLMIQAEKAHGDTAKQSIKKVQDEIQSKHRRAKQHRLKCARITDLMSQRRSTIGTLNRELEQTDAQLSVLRRLHVDHLTKYIFPLEEVQPMSPDKSDMDNNSLRTVSALKEATHTAYVKGRWIYSDSSGDVQYRIVSSFLPGNGDYTAHDLSVSASHENAIESEDPRDNPAYMISAGLCHTGQLMFILMYLLNVRLPRRFCYSEFCGNELTEKQFRGVVTRLNENMLYVCLSQGLPTDDLYIHHTLRNLVILLHSPRLGRCSPFEMQCSLADSTDDNGKSDDSEDGHVTSEDEPDSMEWEEVESEGIPEQEMVYNIGGSDASSGTHSASSSDSTITAATGLMTSAAASVTSFWRAAMSPFERR